MMLRLLVAAVCAVALVGLGGCSTNVEKLDPNAPPLAPSGPVTPPASAPPAAAGASVGASQAPSAAGSHEERLQHVEELEAAYQKKPGDSALKAKLIAAKYDYASKLMNDQNVPPMRKYRPALKQFNEILKLDPGHKEAAEQKQLIEGIYRSMGMPIPQ